MQVTEKTVERERTVDAPAGEVWRALTDDALLSEWLGDEVQLDPSQGGELEVVVGDERRRGRIERMEEERSLVFTWARGDDPPSTVELTLEPAVSGTRVVVVERAGTGPAALSGALWEMRLGGLARLLELALV